MAIISWMAGLFYLPRILVYHAGTRRGSEQSETFKIMENRLIRVIMTPAMVVAWGLGLFMAWDMEIYWENWFVVKSFLVVMLTGYHFWLVVLVGKFARDENRHSGKFYRMINEIPTVLMVGIVVMVIVRPF